MRVASFSYVYAQTPTKLFSLKAKLFFKSEIISYKTYLVNLDNHKALKTMSNSDLFSIRDEILGDLNLFLYLSTFK